MRLNGPSDAAKQLPNTLSIGIRGISAFALLAQLSSQLAASAGAACHSHGGPAISSVLVAMWVSAVCPCATLLLAEQCPGLEGCCDLGIAALLKSVLRPGSRSRLTLSAPRMKL